MKRITFTRQELLDHVWSKPMNALSKDLAISDVGLAKICKRLGVRRPPQGYWNKVVHNKPVPKPELLKGSYPASHTVYLRDSIKSEALQRIKSQEKAEENAIMVPNSLTNPHPWVEAAYKKLEKAKDELGLIQLKSARLPNLSITKAQADRALRIFNTLLRALEDRKIKFWLADHKTWVRVDGEDIEIGLREHSSRRHRTKQEQTAFVKANPGWYRTVAFVDEPNGKLELFLKNDEFFKHYHRGLSELNGSPLETRINAIVIALYRLAEGIKAAREEKRQRDIQYAINSKKWEEERQIKQQEEGRMKKFTEWAESWNKVKQMELFLTQLEAFVQDLPIDHEAHAIYQVAKKRMLTLNPLLNGKVVEAKLAEWGYY